MAEMNFEARALQNHIKYAYTGLSPEFEQAYGRSRPYTMVSKDRQIHQYEAVQYVVKAGIPGAILECGVWLGGSMMMAASALLDVGDRSRDLFLYDTYAGHPKPDAERDIDIHGKALVEEYYKRRSGDGFSDWARVSIEDVEANMRSTGYPEPKIHLIKGKVENTIPAQSPNTIALLRLDTDWYESTLHALRHLFPRLSAGGVLIIDDYGHMKGAKMAVDQYFDEIGKTYLLTRIDYSCRSTIKAF
jgi:O-methyltransferase